MRPGKLELKVMHEYKWSYWCHMKNNSFATAKEQKMLKFTHCSQSEE